MRTARRLVSWMVLLAMLWVADGFAADPQAQGPVLERILAKKELVVGTAADMPPLNMTLKDGKIVGMEVDLAAVLADGLGVKLVLKPMHFNDLLPALAAGQIDAVLSGMTMTPLRNTRVAFAGPYYNSGKSVLTKKASVPALQNSEMMNKPEVALTALRGSTSQVFVERVMPKATLVLSDGYDQAVGMVLSGKVQAMIADHPFCLVSVYRYPDQALATLESPLNYEPIGMALPAGDPLLLNLAQNLINNLANSGDLKLLRKRWFENASWVPLLR